MNFTPEQLKVVLSRVLLYGTMVAKITPTKIDDEILVFLGKFMTEDWFVSLLVDVMQMFKDKPVSKEEFHTHFMNKLFATMSQNN